MADEAAPREPTSEGGHAREADRGEQALREISGRVQEGLARIPGEITVATIFGEPERVGDRVILTAAAVQQAGGFGFGAGGGGGPELEDSGSGAGGAAGVRVRVVPLP